MWRILFKFVLVLLTVLMVSNFSQAANAWTLFSTIYGGGNHSSGAIVTQTDVNTLANHRVCAKSVYANPTGPTRRALCS